LLQLLMLMERRPHSRSCCRHLLPLPLLPRQPFAQLLSFCCNISLLGSTLLLLLLSVLQ
jgi:hypothetical protein